jgi:hypothetical protein
MSLEWRADSPSDAVTFFPSACSRATRASLFMRFFAMTDGVTLASLSPPSGACPSQRASLEFRTQSTYIEDGPWKGG